MTEQHKFVVGMRVRCKEGYSYGTWPQTGDAGTIRSIDENGALLLDESVARGEHYHMKAARFEPLPSPSQPASQWVYRTVLKAWCGPDCPHYRDGRHMVAPDCVCGCGLTYTQAVERGHIPRDSAEAPKELPMPAWEKAVRGWEPMDPYTAHRLSRSDATARELTDARVGNVEARKKLVAALAEELDRPAPVRFPHPGRNFALKQGAADE